MSRLSLQVFSSCLVDSAAIYIMVVKFRTTIGPPPPQLSLHRRAALSSNSNGTRSVYSRKNPKSSLYCDMSMQMPHVDVNSVHCTVQYTVKYRGDNFSSISPPSLKCHARLGLSFRICSCVQCSL
jgi:hypothetical protein